MQTESEQPQSLMINRIILDNFKSYYGHLEIGPFHNQFTSIVGPNGSGKSNLIESLLFVFGKKASWMRLQKIHQLIHNSAKHNDVKKASVEVQFIENTVNGQKSFSVRRTVHHTGQSNYEVNDKHATLDEVTTLLKSKGIDLTNNRFLILQGEVEQISLMKPKSGDQDKPGLLEYLEDIIGSNQFQEKIEKYTEEYLSLDVYRREKGEMMRVVEMDLEKLEPGKDKAVELVRSEQKNFQLQNVQQQIVNYKSQQQFIKCQECIKNNEEQSKLLIQEGKQKTAENQEIIKQYKIASNKTSKYKQIVQNHKNKLDELQSLDSQGRDEVRHLSTQQVKQEKKQDEIKTERNKCIDDIADCNNEIPKIEEIVKKLGNEKDQLEEIVQTLNQQHQQEVRKLVEQKQQLQNIIKKPTLEKNELQREIDFAKTQLNELKLPELDNGKGIQKTLSECTKTITEYEKHKDIFTNTLNEIKNRDKQTQEQLNITKKEIKINEEQILDIQQQIDGNSYQQNQQNEQNATIRAIMNAAQQGQLKGVIGRIGDLGSIDPVYDIAISTACGKGFDSILVEDQKSAEQCVQFLKNNRIGRHTFMSLDYIQKTINDTRYKGNIPQQTQRLMDLIKIQKDEYLPVFFRIVGHTLVCDNIDIAKNLKFERKINGRYVTLDGKLIEPNGLMSGGGQVKRGALNTSKHGKNQMQGEKINQQQLEGKLKQLQIERQQLEQKILSIDHEVTTLIKDQKIIQEKLVQTSQDIQQQKELKQDLENKLQKIQDLEKNKNKIIEQRKEFEQIILKNQNKIDEIEKQIQKEKIQLQQIEEEISSSENKQLKQNKEKLSKLTTEFEKEDSNFKQLNSQLAISQKKMKKLDQEEKTCSNELQKIIKKINDTQENLKKNEEQFAIISKDLTIAFEELQQADKEYKELQQKNKEFDEIIYKLKEKQKKIQQDNEDLQTQLKKANDDHNVGSAKLEQIRLNYKEMCNEYDFLTELEEIANWRLQEQQIPQTSANPNQSILNISFVDQQGDESFDDGRKRGATLAIDLKAILDINVNDDLTEEQINQFCPIEKDIGRVHAHLQAQIRDITKDANIKDIDEFKIKFKEYKLRKTDFDECKAKLHEQKIKIDTLKKERYDLFMYGFNVIGSKLRETYQTLTNGGDAELELVDTMDPFSEGISFSVRPKNKSWKQMSKLSGGEKTLSSLSLIFALHYYKPTPLYFFDEVDAALDYKNVSIVGNFIKERTKNAQFIVISLRNNMFELANKLIGIYKTFDTTKTISIQPELVQQKIKKTHDNNENVNQNK